MTGDYLAWFTGRDGSGVPDGLAATLRQRQCVRRWQGERVTLFADQRLPLLADADGHGVVAGHLFDRAFNLATSCPAMSTGTPWSATLINDHWGGYVAIAETARGMTVLRDPSGGVGCYHAAIGDSHVVTSLPHLLTDCGLAPLEIDWRQILISLVRHSSRPGQTALRGIGEVAPGDLLTVAGGHASSEPVWDPWRHARRPPTGQPHVVLAAVLNETLEAWGRTCRRPLIEISGGLDSAIAAAGIVRGAPEASLISFAAAPGDPDERDYARAVARHLDRPLEITIPRIEDVDLTMSLSRDLPRPNARAFTQAADLQSLAHARKIDADAFVSGGGGDDVFCYLRSILPAIDRLHGEGLRGMMDSTHDIAVMNHATLWDAWLRIIKLLFHVDAPRPTDDRRFILHNGLGRPSEPSNEPPVSKKCPGKAEHVAAVTSIHNYLEGHRRSDHAPILSPLLSQPIVECCLAIPTWHWCKGGQNRAVARRAFEGQLPRLAINRRSKGSFDAFCALLLHDRRDQVEEMLMDGRLSREGLLDRDAVHHALRNPSPPAANVSRLLSLVDVESWVASWSGRSG